MTKKILTLAISAFVFPALAFAATFSFSPALGNYSPGDTINTSIYVNPEAGETITATKLSLDYPADKLELVSYTPVNGSPILAHVGTKTDVAGKIVDNIAFNPGITSSTKVATVTFKAKSEGAATLSVAQDAQILDSTNTNKKSANSSASYTLSAPTAPSTTQNDSSAQQSSNNTNQGAQAQNTSQSSGTGTKSAKTTSAEKSSKKEKESATSTNATSTSENQATSTQNATSSDNENLGEQVAAAGETQSKKTWLWWLIGLILLAGAAYGFYRSRK